MILGVLSLNISKYEFVYFQDENRILNERESKLRERERMLSISQDSLQTITDHQVKVKMAAIEEVSF